MEQLALHVPNLELLLWDVKPKWTREQRARAIWSAIGIGLAFELLIALAGLLIRSRTAQMDNPIWWLDGRWFLLSAILAYRAIRSEYLKGNLTQQLAKKAQANELYLHSHAPVRAALERCASAVVANRSNPSSTEMFERALEATGHFVRWNHVSLHDFKRAIAIDPEAREAVAKIDAIRTEIESH